MKTFLRKKRSSELDVLQKTTHKSYNLNNNNFKSFENKPLLCSIPRRNQFNTGDSKLIRLFKTFVKFSSTRNSNYFNKSFSLKFFFYSPNGKELALSLNKMFIKWKTFYLLLFNVFYYEISFLVFSNSFFQREILALNWTQFDNPIMCSMFRYIKPFLTLKLGQIVNYGSYLFRILRLNNVSISLVTDLLYHNKTLYYLKLNRFFIIGLTNSSSLYKDVDVVLPINSNSIFTQLFFIRFLVLIKKDSKDAHFKYFRQNWFDLIKILNS